MHSISTPARRVLIDTVGHAGVTQVHNPEYLMKAVFLAVVFGSSMAQADCPLPKGKSTYSCLIDNQVSKVEVSVDSRDDIETIHVNDRAFIADGNIHESTPAGVANGSAAYRVWCVNKTIYFTGHSKVNDVETRIDAHWVFENDEQISVTSQMEMTAKSTARGDLNYKCERVSPKGKS